MAIQFRRGTAEKISASTEVPAAGQPVYDTTNNKLYVGDGTTKLKNLSAIGGDSSATSGVTISTDTSSTLYLTSHTSTSGTVSGLKVRSNLYVSGSDLYVGGTKVAKATDIPTITYDSSTGILDIVTN